MNKLSILSLIIILLIIPLAQCEIETLGIFKQESCIELIQICSNCSYVNISSVLYPNSTQVLGQVKMTKIGTKYNYTSCGISKVLGRYIVNGFGDVDGVITGFAYDYEVSATGKNLTSAKAISYILIFIVSFILFIGFLIIGIYLPSNNKSDEMTGYIIAVSNLKYLKMLCLCLSYLVAMFISYFAWMVCHAYLDMDFVTSIFRFLFTAQVVMLLPLFILFVYIVIANLVRDSKLGEMLSRGLHVK